MSTRSRVAIQHDDHIHSIYVHHDGYISGVGAVLLANYDTVDKIVALMALGDLSALYANIAPPAGVKHSFNSPLAGVTIAYGRDRGETNIEARRAVNETELLEQADGSDAEYVYLFRDGQWLVTSHGAFRAAFLDHGASNWKDWTPLADELRPVDERAEKVAPA